MTKKRVQNTLLQKSDVYYATVDSINWIQLLQFPITHSNL